MPASLPTRKLGRDGPEVAAIGYGAMGLSAFYGPVPADEERFAILDRAYELGQTFWDTADGYLDSEDLLGRWFARTGKRDEIFLATKFGYRGDESSPLGFRIDSSAEYARQACERSLKRLGVETIDLYYVHRVNYDTPIEETIRGLVELKKEGKIRYIGLSEVSADTLRRAHAVHPIAAVQMEYSPFALEIESEKTGLLKTARELGIAVVAYSPLGRGLFASGVKTTEELEKDDYRLTTPKFQGENFKKNLQLAEKFEAVAKRKGITTGQLTLAWLLAQGDDIIPIPGTKKMKYLEENIAAVHVQLTPEEVAEVRSYVDEAEVAGGRYDASLDSLLFADTVPLDARKE